jgi:hypothetical protein
MGLFRSVGVEVVLGGVGVYNAVGVLECAGSRGDGEEKGSKEVGGGEKSFNFVFTRNKIGGV